MMKTHRATGSIVAFLAVFALLVGVSTARASGFAIVEQSVSGLGNAYAGWAASAEDPSTIFYNPAGITRLKGSQATLGLHAILPKVEFKNDGSTHVLDQYGITDGLTGDDGDDGGSLALVPNAYYTYNPGTGVAFGIGVYAPWGLKTEYDDHWVGRYHAVTSDMKTIDINPTVAIKATDKLSLGLGFNIQYLQVELSNMIDFGTIFVAAGATPQQDDGKVTLDADNFGYGWNAGLLYEFSESTRLGFSYRSRVKHRVEGDADFTVPSNIQPMIDANAPGLFADVGATGKITLPDTASLSLYHKYDKLALMADVTWTHWALFKELTVEFENAQPDSTTTENWDNTWRYSLGATYTLLPELDLRCGLAYDESPVPSAEYRTPRVPDEDRFWVAMGAAYQITPALKLDGAYVHIFVKDATVDKEPEGEDELRGGLKGDFSYAVDILSAQLTYNF